MTKDGFSCFIGFRNFPGEDPPNPPSRIESVWFIFQSNTAQHKPLSSKWGWELGSDQQEWFSVLIYDRWAIILLAKYLLHSFHTIIYHDMDLEILEPDKILENLTFICSLFLLEFQWNNLYFA